MQTDVLIPVSWRSRPRSFVALMSLYESSYLRLRALCGEPALLGGERISRVEGDCDLALTVIEQTPYTTALNLSYLLPDAAADSGYIRFPDLEIRVYSDARLAEARRCAAEPRHPVLRNLGAALNSELDRRWVMNVMLNKWLEYCLERGHRFT